MFLLKYERQPYVQVSIHAKYFFSMYHTLSSSPEDCCAPFRRVRFPHAMSRTTKPHCHKRQGNFSYATASRHHKGDTAMATNAAVFETILLFLTLVKVGRRRCPLQTFDEVSCGSSSGS